MKISIRKFRLSDATAVSTLIRRAQLITLKGSYPLAVRKQGARKRTPENVRERSRLYDLYVAWESDKAKVIGVIGLNKNEVRTFFVDPVYQGKGIGRLLYERIRKKALLHTYSTLVVYSSPYAVPIYQKFGFKRVRKVRKELGGIIYYNILMKQSLK